MKLNLGTESKFQPNSRTAPGRKDVSVPAGPEGTLTAGAGAMVAARGACDRPSGPDRSESWRPGPERLQRARRMPNSLLELSDLFPSSPPALSPFPAEDILPLGQGQIPACFKASLGCDWRPL